MLKVVVDQAALQELVTLEEAVAHLRVDGSDEDELIALYLDAAVLSCLDYCDLKLVPVGAEPAFRAAALLTLGGLYGSRESVIAGTIVALNPTVEGLLRPYRTIRI